MATQARKSQGLNRVEGPDLGRLGKLVKSMRRARGMTQQVLADKSGISVDSVRRVERGRFCPSVDLFWRLVHGLGSEVSAVFLAFEEERPSERSEPVEAAP